MSGIKLGEALEKKRIRTGQNINMIVKKTGLSYMQVKAIEESKSNYTRDSLLLYCKAVGIKLDELISQYA